MSKLRNFTSVREFMALVSAQVEALHFKRAFFPILALDYSVRKRKDHLSSWCKVGGIPSFVVFDKNSTLITRDGRAAISRDRTGDDCPWCPI